MGNESGVSQSALRCARIDASEGAGRAHGHHCHLVTIRGDSCRMPQHTDDIELTIIPKKAEDNQQLAGFRSASRGHSGWSASSERLGRRQVGLSTEPAVV